MLIWSPMSLFVIFFYDFEGYRCVFPLYVAGNASEHFIL